MANKGTTQKDISNIQNLRVMVSSPCFDNIGEVLEQLRVKHIPLSGIFDCDILFLNCGTKDTIDSSRLKTFVEKGGILYASDWTSDHLINAWPGIMSVNKSTKACKVRAVVVDADLKKHIGNSVDVEFDLPAWVKIDKASDAKILMQSAEEGYPIMLEFSIGKGKVFYTSFHNHAQTSEMEKKLLQLLVIKQISAATDIDFQTTMDIMSLNQSGIAQIKSSEPQKSGTSTSIMDKWKISLISDKPQFTEQAKNIGSKWRK